MKHPAAIALALMLLALPASADNRNYAPDDRIEDVAKCREDPDCATLTRRLERSAGQRERDHESLSAGEKLVRAIFGIGVIVGGLWAFYAFVFGFLPSLFGSRQPERKGPPNNDPPQ